MIPGTSQTLLCLTLLCVLPSCQVPANRVAELPPDLRPPAGARGVTLSHVRVNGLRLRIAEQGDGPLVLLLHGWPESWYSWRHQLAALANGGYRAVAPDLRGYGGSDRPPLLESYDIVDLTDDVIGLLDALGEKRCVLVGHDWGALVAWYSVLLYPDRFTGLVAMSVPHSEARGNRPPTEAMGEQFGESFFYMLYFQEPGVAEAEFDAEPRALLSRLLTSPGTPREPATISDSRASAGGLIGRIGAPTERPSWLREGDLEYMVADLVRSGFRGGLNYYRNIDRNWQFTPGLVGHTVPVPTLFLAGEQDLVIRGQSAASLESMMRPVAPRLQGVHLIPDTGHWVQQERPGQVNTLLLDFLSTLPPPP